MPPLGLARENVGQMHLGEWHTHARQGVVDREARVTVGPSVYQRAVSGTLQRLYRIDDFALTIELCEADGDVVLFGHFTQPGLDFREGRPSINRRLTRSEQVEIGTS